jgi:ribonuclease HI
MIVDGLRAQLKSGQNLFDGMPVVGSDGGAEKTLKLFASYGIAIYNGSEVRATAKGRVPGFDQSSYVAEVYALLQVLLAAEVAQCSVVLVIDNAAVVRQMRSILSGRLVAPGFYFGWWNWIALIISRNAHISHVACWVPSHNKKMVSYAPEIPIDPLICRQINKAADELASDALRHASEQCIRDRNRELGRADKMAQSALTILRTAEDEYRQSIQRQNPGVSVA